MEYLGKSSNKRRAEQLASGGLEPLPLCDNYSLDQDGNLVISILHEEDEEKWYNWYEVVNKRNKQAIEYVYGNVDYCVYKGIIWCEDTTYINKEKWHKKALRADKKANLFEKKHIKTLAPMSKNFSRKNHDRLSVLMCEQTKCWHNYYQAILSEKRRVANEGTR